MAAPTASEFDDLLGYDAVTVAVAEVTKITMVADVGDSLDGKYFQLATGGSAVVTHHVWFNTSGGSASDPAPGTAAIVVAITTGDNPITIAGLVQAAINATFPAVDNTDGSVTITNAAVGAAADVVDIDAGVTVNVLIKGKSLDGRFAPTVAEFQTALSLTSQEDDHFNELWKTQGGNIRITGMSMITDSSFAQTSPPSPPDNTERRVLFLGDTTVYSTLGAGFTAIT